MDAVMERGLFGEGNEGEVRRNLGALLGDLFLRDLAGWLLPPGA